MGSQETSDHEGRIAELERKVTELYERIGQAEPAQSTGPVFASDAPKRSAVEEDPRLLAAIDTGNEIQAIKLYRELTGAGLADAKIEVDRIASMRR